VFFIKERVVRSWQAAVRLAPREDQPPANFSFMTKLSLAAQAVLIAFSKYPLHGDHIADNLMYGALPEVLRTAANQLDHATSAHTLYAIADELEAFAQ